MPPSVEVVVGVIAMVAFWGLVLFVLPTIVVLYLANLFPLTGQWRSRFREWRERRR